MALEKHENNHYVAYCDLQAMRTVANDHHPHIVHYYGALVDRFTGELHLFLEPVDASLDKIYPILHSSIQPEASLLDRFIQRLTKHIILALDHLKSKKLIHKNIKPGHILVGRQLIFKLCDFGFCGVLSRNDLSDHGHPYVYVPPEYFQGIRSYGIRSDMWALGITLVEISQGHLPLESEPIFSVLLKMQTGWQPDIPPILSQPIRDVLSKLVSNDRNQRPKDYSEILSMESMTHLEDKPTEDEIILINKLIDLLPEETFD